MGENIKRIKRVDYNKVQKQWGNLQKIKVINYTSNYGYVEVQTILGRKYRELVTHCGLLSDGEIKIHRQSSVNF